MSFASSCGANTLIKSIFLLNVLCKVKTNTMQKWAGMIACYSNANLEQDIKRHFVLVKGEVGCSGLLLCSFCEMEDKKQDHRINNPIKVEMKTKWFMI